MVSHYVLRSDKAGWPREGMEAKGNFQVHFRGSSSPCPGVWRCSSVLSLTQPPCSPALRNTHYTALSDISIMCTAAAVAMGTTREGLLGVS